ncbi:hypothetical protein B0A48_13064 [Cryoendolithus antarcticus]|uniref:Protein CMS1 n=1 Tax=Cryoendolithus antarcticus TaxID=1507870 RepID=A0A1V8SNC7_9PEZI|nr:hypothetical protein B0A48_13064 [Cryoendolithus antarcticus]
MSDSEDALTGVPLIESVSDAEPSTPGTPANSKRKREEDAPVESKRAAKRRKNPKKPKDVQEDSLDLEKGVNLALAHMDSRLMADHMAQRTTRFRPDVSPVEAEDFMIPERAILDTTAFTATRTTDQLPAYLEKFAGWRRSKKGQKLVNAPEPNGAPHTIVVAGAGLRAADLTRQLRKYQTKESMVAKLFAKHIKLAEAVAATRGSRMGIGVGTPQRIIDLLDEGALKSDYVERILVDASHIDQKKRGLLDMKETQVPLVDLLTRPEFRERYGAADCKVELLFF